MLSPNNLIILKKYKDSRHLYYTDKIFNKFITELNFSYSKNMDDNNYKRLFVLIFINNIIKYLY